MPKVKAGIIVSTTRQGRFGDKPATWMADIAARRDDIDAQIVDLRDYPLPWFDEIKLPAQAPPQNEVARQWGAKMAELDAFVFVTAEYNHGIPGVLKNALDYAYPQYGRKPAGFVGYGGVGAARAIQQLRLICVALGMAPLAGGPNIAGGDFMAAMSDRPLREFGHLEKAADALFADLAWWAAALRSARDSA